MRDYELIEAIEKVVATDGEEMTDGECLDQVIELVNEYKSFNFESKGAQLVGFVLVILLFFTLPVGIAENQTALWLYNLAR